jgi:hypothetical protein
LIGLLLLLGCGAAIVLLLLRVPDSGGGQRVAWIAMAAALTALTIGIAVLLRALPTMRYRFTDDALIVEWLGERRVVRFDEIVDVTFAPRRPVRLGRWEPFWPGYYVATARTPEGTWHSWATQQPHRRVRIVTARGIVAISPERPVRFVAELNRLVQAHVDPVSSPPRSIPTAIDRSPQEPDESPPGSAPGPTRQRTVPTARSRRPGAASNPILGWLVTFRDLFRDRLLGDQVSSVLVATGVVLPVLMVAYLYGQYEGLPQQIPIRWDASGEVEVLSSPGGLWRFPRIAFTLLVVNTVLATLAIEVDRYLSRLLLAGVPAAQVILFVALVRAVN